MKRIVGYTDPLSVEPGETITAYVSCEPPIRTFEAQVVRMLAGDSFGRGRGIRFEAIHTGVAGPYPAIHQQFHPGSFALVQDVAMGTPNSATVGVTFKPTLDVKGAVQALVCLGDPWGGRGMAILIDERGRPGVAVSTTQGPEMVASKQPLEPERWYRLMVEALVSGEVELHLSGVGAEGSDRKTAAKLQHQVVLPTQTQIVLGAAARTEPVSGPQAVHRHFNGVVERPWIVVNRRLTPREAAALSDPTAADLPEHVATSVIALWDFSKQIETWRVVDIGRYGYSGELMNLPRRAVCGSNWDGSVERWVDAPSQYGGVHFLRDGVGDCAWSPSIRFEVPESFRSGFYAFRLVADGEQEFLPFFVKPKLGRPTASVVMLVPTATYLSYGNSRFWWEDPIQEAVQDRLLEIGPEDEWVLNHPEVGPSAYDLYDDGTDVCYVSRLRPNLMMRPGHCRHEGYIMDLYLIEWLDHLGYGFDVVTDEDLDRFGVDLIKPYQVLITGTHPEYISTKEWDSLKSFRDEGGRIMYLGGNGIHARIAFDPTHPWIMENRRTAFWLNERPQASGERYLSLDGERGGLLEFVDRPPIELFGVTSVTMGFDESRPFHRRLGQTDPRAKFVFAGVDDEAIGDFGIVLGGAVGQEWDNAAGYSHPGHIVLASSEGHSLVPALFGAFKRPYHCDMVLLLSKGGGAVFSASSMAWCGALPYNGFANNVSRVTRNVLDRFLNPARFES